MAVRRVLAVRAVLAALCAVLAVPFAGCASLPLEQQPWVEVRSANFRFVSQLDAEKTVALTRRLERFKLVVERVARTPPLEARVPTTIVLFSDRASYLQIGPEYSVGVFMPGLRANHAVVDGTGGGSAATRVLLHEYTHYIINNSQAFTHPAWYNEGFAELMSGTIETADAVAVGKVLPDRLLRPEQRDELSLARIMNERPGAFAPYLQGIYYAKAWLLVHYLSYGWDAGFPDRSKQRTKYLTLVHEGMSPEQACQEAFETNFAQLDLELDKYVRSRLPIFALPRSALAEPPAPQVRALSAAEVAGELGTAALRAGSTERAESLFRAQLALRPDSAPAHFGLADAVRQQRQAAAEYEPLYARGIQLGAGDALAEVDYGEYLVARAAALEDGAPERGELLTRAREHLRRATELDPDLPEAHARLGATYLEFPGEEDLAKGFPSIERANQLLGSSRDITYLMALGHFQANRLDEAQRFVGLARARSHGEFPAVEQLAAQIEAVRSSVAAPPPGPGAGGAP